MGKPKKKETTVFIDIAPIAGCKNPDSYGEICVFCNRCGRFTEKKEKKS